MEEEGEGVIASLAPGRGEGVIASHGLGRGEGVIAALVYRSSAAGVCLALFGRSRLR